MIKRRVIKMTDCSGWIFKIHDYEEWKMISQGDIARTSFFNNTEYTAGFWTKQQRICRNCGYIQTKIDKVMG